MQKNAMAEKRIVLVDGMEMPGLTKVGPLPLEQATIEVPGFQKIRVIVNGVTKIPPVDMTFRADRSTKTRDFLISWFDNQETHDVVIIETDNSGQEFGRILAPQVQLSKIDAGEYTAENPTFAHVDIIMAPYDLLYVKAQQ